MSPKRHILQTLRGAAASPSEQVHLRPPTIPGYSAEPERYQRAVNELLQARLVEGRKDAEGHMTIALNHHRRGEVERILKPMWARPGVWASLALIAVLGAWFAV